MAANLKKPEDYKGKSFKFPMPSGKIDPRLKTSKDYHLAVAQSLMAYWVDGKFLYPYGAGRSIQELWDYAQGRQSMDKIKSALITKKNKNNGRFMTKMNISWDGYAKLPQLFDVMRSKNMSQEYDADLYCVDNDSIVEKEKSRNALKYILDEQTKAFVSRSQMKPNFQIDPEQLGLQSQEDVDMYFDSGAFTLEWEIAAISALQKSKTEGNYKEFQDTIFDNLIINKDGFAGARTYIDKSDGIPKVRAIDVKNALCPYFKGFDSKGKIMRAGELVEMTIADIAKLNPSLSNSELLYIANQFKWMNPEYEKSMEGNSAYSNNYISSFVTDTYGNHPLYNVKVLVLDYQFITGDMERYLKNDRRELFKEIDYDFKLKKKAESDGDYVVEKNRLKRYEGQWIVGTKNFITFGETKDQIYYGEDGNKVPELDFHFVKTGNMSLIERCVSIVDDMNMALIKERNIWATIPAAPAMLISKHMIENVFMNGRKMSYDEIVSDFIEKGILLFDGVDEFNKPLYGLNGNKPIDFANLQNIVGMLSTASTHMANKVNELKDILGLQGGVDGGAMDRYQGLGQTQLAFEASNSSLNPTFNAYKYMFKNVMSDLIRKWQMKAKKQKDLKVPYKGLSPRSMKMLELSHPFTTSDFNIEVVIQPTAEERATLLADLRGLRQASVQSGNAIGLSASEYMLAYEKIMAGNLKGCMYLLGKIEAKKAALMRQKQIQDQEYNIQSQQASAQTKLMGDKELQQIKNQGTANVAMLQTLSDQMRDLQKLLLSGQKENESRPNEFVAANMLAEKQQDFETIAAESIAQSQQQNISPQQQATSQFMSDTGQGGL